MNIETKLIEGNRLKWKLRCPKQNDALELSRLRVISLGHCIIKDFLRQHRL